MFTPFKFHENNGDILKKLYILRIEDGNMKWKDEIERRNRNIFSIYLNMYIYIFCKTQMRIRNRHGT